MTAARPARSDDAIEIEVGPRAVRVSHPDRVIWPRTGTTKRELIEYLVAIAPVLIPHLRDRATMVWRFPEGVDGPGWFQAQCRNRPAWVPTFDVTGKRGDTLQYCVIEEPATLAWLANLGTIEFHPHGWRIDRPDDPTALLFDLDPGPPAGLAEAASVALRIRERLLALGLEPRVKTSGWLGMHVVVPLAPRESFERTKAFARRLAEDLARETPDAVVARNDRERRVGRVYVDWIQNDRNRQLVAAYSPRATPVPQVSLPVSWDDVALAAGGIIDQLRPGFAGVLTRMDRVGDVWAGTVPEGVLPPDR